MKTAMITLVLVLGLAGMMHTEAFEGPDLVYSRPEGKAGGPPRDILNIEEEWYFEFTIGSSAITFPEFVNEEVAAAEETHGPFTSSSFDFEIGFYWPVDDYRNDLLGLVLTGVSTMYSPVTSAHDPGTGETQDVFADASFIGLSYMRFFGEQVGDGLFLRGDISFLGSFVSVTNDFDQTRTMRDGTFAGLAGIGYGWIPQSWQTRVLVQVRYQTVILENDRSAAWSTGVTFLY